MATGLQVWARVILLATVWVASTNSFVLRKAAPQGLDIATGRETPIEVLAEQEIEWQKDSKRLIARGNARLSRGNVVIQADVLMAYYRERSKGAAEIYQVQAAGHVRITSLTQAASGDTADYTVDDRLLRLIGRPARLATPTETLTASEVIEYHEVRRNLVARGDVHVTTREGRMLRGDMITADLLPYGLQKAEWEQDKITRLTASGNVRIETAEEVIRGKHGTYDAETGLATLSGSVKITRGSNQLNGGHAIVNLKTGWGQMYAVAPGLARQNNRTGTEGRVRLLFVPEKQDIRGDAGKRGGCKLTSTTVP